MTDDFVMNSEKAKQEYHAKVDALFSEYPYWTFPKPRKGEDRSISQNSLFHVWITDFAAHLVKCDKSEVTNGMVEGLKKTIKGWFYRETQYPWMVHKVICPLTKREKTDYTSSTTWKRGEMFEVLNWFQAFAAERGCILDSRGEHAKLTRE